MIVQVVKADISMRVVTRAIKNTHRQRMCRCISSSTAGSATGVIVAAGATARAERRVVHVAAVAAFPPAGHRGPNGCVDYGGVGVLDLVGHGCKTGER